MKLVQYFFLMDTNVIIKNIKEHCPCREKLAIEVVDAIFNKNINRILLVGATGSGKSRFAKKLISQIDPNYQEITASIAYDSKERQSIYDLSQKMSNQIILIEELSDFSMKTTSRDRRLTVALSNMLFYPDLIIATTRDITQVDPSLLNNFPNIFYMKPPNIEERKLLLESVYTDNEETCPLLAKQYHDLETEEQKLNLLKQFAGLQPAEILSAKPLEKESPFAKIAGASDILKKLEFLVLKPLMEREAFVKMGVLPPRGVLLTGPSGCGKTLIARSIGKASRVSFFDVTCTEIISKEVGESERRLHAVFERARASAPALILFDDIDAIAPPRTFGATLNEAADRLLTTLLVETDGLTGRDDGVIVMATTSRINAIDPAVTRPGRFDYIVDILSPNDEQRSEIFDLYSTNVPIKDKDEIKKLVVEATKGRTGADIEGIVREAAMIALRESLDSKEIVKEHFEKALEPYRMKNKLISSEVEDIEEGSFNAGPSRSSFGIKPFSSMKNSGKSTAATTTKSKRKWI